MKCGQKMETYSRIVGYYRPVQNWNKGKKHEFEKRKTFNLKKAVAKCDDEKKSLLTAQS